MFAGGGIGFLRNTEGGGVQVGFPVGAGLGLGEIWTGSPLAPLDWAQNPYLRTYYVPLELGVRRQVGGGGFISQSEPLVGHQY